MIVHAVDAPVDFKRVRCEVIASACETFAGLRWHLCCPSQTVSDSKRSPEKSAFCAEDVFLRDFQCQS